MSNNNTVNLNIRLTGNAGRELAGMMRQLRTDTRTVNDINRLGLRTQQQITDEIRNAERAYRRLSQSANTSSNDLRRAYQAMRQQVRQLNDELRTTPRLTQRIGNAFNTGTAIVGGVAAGAAVVNSQIQPARSYDKRLSDLTITATDFGDSYAKMDSVKKQLNTAIEASAKYGSKDDAVTAAEIMMSSGAYSRENLATALTTTTKTAFAANADPAAVASTTIALKNFGITVNDMDKAMNALYLGGKMGSFELKDQAKWLPNQLASVGSLGYNNVEGIKRIAAMNQIAMRTAGTTDEAGNNIVNFTDKIASKNFADAIAKNIKPQKGDPTKNGKLDWVNLMKNERGKGVLPVDAFVNLMNRELANNTEYQKLKNQKVDKNNPEAMKANIEGMMKIIEGTNIAKILTDRQARAGALALTKYNDDYQGMVSQMGQNGDAINKDAGWLSQQESSTYQQRINEQMNINYQAYLNVNGALNTFNTEMSGFMEKHSGLATAAYSAGVALATLGAAATVGSLITKFGSLGGVMTSATTGINALGASSVAAKAGLLGLAGMVGWEIGSAINEHLVEGTAFGDKTGEYIAKGLAFLGNENAQQALDAQAKYEQMIQEQQQTRLAIQQTTNAIKSIDFSQNIVQNITNPQPNVPFFNLPAPTHQVADLKRGAVLPLWLK